MMIDSALHGADRAASDDVATVRPSQPHVALSPRGGQRGARTGRTIAAGVVLAVALAACTWRSENRRGTVMLSGTTAMLAGVGLVVADGRCYGTFDKDTTPHCEHVNDTQTIGETMIYSGAVVGLIGAVLLVAMVLDTPESAK